MRVIPTACPDTNAALLDLSLRSRGTHRRAQERKPRKTKGSFSYEATKHGIVKLLTLLPDP
jgi:hypothetical protein